MNDWWDVWSAKTIARINSQEVSSESYRHAVSAALAQWDQSTGDLSDRLPDHVGYMAPPSVIAVADEPIIHSPNLPIPGGSEVATQGATDREGMPGRPVPQKRSWLTGEGTWLRSNDEPAPTDRTWWQFGGEMVRSAVELTPAMQFNEMVQQCNEYFDRPVYFNEMADALDGSTQNIMNVFSFGATDYVGATQTDTFQGWQWDWQRSLFTISRELLIGAATGGAGTMMSTSTGAARYAWGGVWIAGLGYDSYNMGQHSSQAYEDFRQGDIRGGLWHTGLAVVSAFGLRAGLKGSALGKAGSTVDETSALAKVADEAPSNGVLRDFSPDYVGVLANNGKVIRQSANLPATSSLDDLLASGHLPGSTGVTVTDRVVVFEKLWQLSAKHDVEFALTKELVDGRYVYRVYSGARGFVDIPSQNLIRRIAHTHPSGNPMISASDLVNHNRTWLRNFERNGMDLYTPIHPSRVIYGSGAADDTLFWSTILR